MPVVEGAIRRLGNARYSWSFALDGGAIGAIPLRGPQLTPSSTVLGGYLEVLTPVGSGGAGTGGLTLEATGDILAAIAVSGAPWSTAGRKSIIPVFTGASSLRPTQLRSVVLTVGGFALNAGAFDLVLITVDV